MSISGITLRKATMDDAIDLLRWKNEEDTRRNSIVTSEIIQLEDHLIWLAKTLRDPSVEFFIVQLDGEAIGDLRLNHGEAETEVSIRLDKKFRGKGVATMVVGMVPTDRTLMAKIVAHNLASMRVFIANGYRPEDFVLGPVSYYVYRKFKHETSPVGISGLEENTES